jgi:serine/threonine protein kinase
VKEDQDFKYLSNEIVLKIGILKLSGNKYCFRYFALELCDASLDRLFLNENDPKKYRGPMPTETDVLLQLAKGLMYIHQMKYVHRDIKPSNALIALNSTTQQHC